jgi:hypothetical protein
MNEHLQEEQLILHYYGESENAIAVDGHLAGCDQCRAEYRSLMRTLNSIDEPVPVRGADYGAEVWKKIAPQVGVRGWWRDWFAPKRWVPIGAVAALVMAAFLSGRYYQQTQGPVQTAAGQVRERVLLVAVGDHLERSKMVLVELMNAQPGEELNIAAEKTIAENLVESNRLFRQTANATGESAVAGVLDDLERVLLEIAHGPEQLSGDQLNEIRHRIESQGLLFKVRVVESQVRARETDKPESATGLPSTKL